MVLTPNVDTLRLFLHLLGASVWIGGQIVVAGIVPLVRAHDPQATSAVARGFARVAWPGFGLAVVTGIWGMLSLEGTPSAAYNATLGVKVLLVFAAGAMAVVHSRSEHNRVKGATGAAGAFLSLYVLYLGVTLTTAG